MVVVLNLDKLGNVDRSRTRCYAMAPARCMSLNLAVRYADVINSVVLQVSHTTLIILMYSAASSHASSFLFPMAG
jgi:hypothetical protein